MILAKNNIFVKINNGREYAILNPVSGSFDLMDEQEYELLQKIDQGQIVDQEFTSYLIGRGYAFESRQDQDAAINKAYREFHDEVADSQVQLMLVPTYGCNLACTYCFQHGIEGRPALISEEAVDAFSDYARANFSNGRQKPFITLFGGEPLVNSPAQRKIIEYIVEKCAAEDYELAAVTNGYDFTDYVELLKKARIKEIQFTVDGSKAVHDARRATTNGKGTFDRVIAGIEAAVKNKMPVNLRSVVDTQNIEDLVNLAEYLDQKGWLDLPAELFKTQIGRNYELFECYAKPQHLMTQVELWGEFSSLSKVYPVLSKFHRPDFKGIRHLVDTGEMYMASFDTCPACKTEWVFDLFGNIYGCTASCGREEYLLGTYWPKVLLNSEAVETWQKRDVKSIAKCRDCRYDVICGGGCGVVAAGQNDGNILSPDCRPVQGLLELGVNHYIDPIRFMSGEERPEEGGDKPVPDCSCGKEEEKVACCGSEEEKSPCCSGQMENPKVKSSLPEKKKTQGCHICGRELIYCKGLPEEETCIICGRQFETYVKCPAGHFVCDTCHSSDILGRVEQFLTASQDQNPAILAQKVFELPGLNMHGPEYHSIVPAVLVTAYQNLTGTKEPAVIREAIQRGRSVKGGSCGFYGNCGSGVGAGIAMSLIEQATPMSRDERGDANRATAYALLEISRFGGPRCCKREAVTSIKSFMETTHYFDQLPKYDYTCRQSGKNKDCIGKKCPYFPARKLQDKPAKIKVRLKNWREKNNNE